jgi:hypothetical protein
MILLYDVDQVDAHFDLVGDSVSVDTR